MEIRLDKIEYGGKLPKGRYWGGYAKRINNQRIVIITFDYIDRLQVCYIEINNLFRDIIMSQLELLNDSIVLIKLNTKKEFEDFMFKVIYTIISLDIKEINE